MEIQVLIFGQLKDITETNLLVLEGLADTDALIAELNNRYPILKDTKYMIAVDRKTINGNSILKQESQVALLPPFSGG